MSDSECDLIVSLLDDFYLRRVALADIAADVAVGADEKLVAAIVDGFAEGFNDGVFNRFVAIAAFAIFEEVGVGLGFASEFGADAVA